MLEVNVVWALQMWLLLRMTLLRLWNSCWNTSGFSVSFFVGFFVRLASLISYLSDEVKQQLTDSSNVNALEELYNRTLSHPILKNISHTSITYQDVLTERLGPEAVE